MRLAVISDIHGNLLALEAVIADIGARGVDATVNLGDNVAGPLWPRETAERLATLALPTVRGNHDRWMLDREDDSVPETDRFARAALTIEQRHALHALPPTINIGEALALRAASVATRAVRDPLMAAIRFARAVAAVSDWCRENRHWSIRDQHRHLSSMMRGGVTVDDPGGRQRVASQDFIEAVPSEPARSVQVYAALSPRDDVVPAKDRFLTV